MFIESHQIATIIRLFHFIIHLDSLDHFLQVIIYIHHLIIKLHLKNLVFDHFEFRPFFRPSKSPPTFLVIAVRPFLKVVGIWEIGCAIALMAFIKNGKISSVSEDRAKILGTNYSIFWLFQLHLLFEINL